jgi:KaiC/GvpD/RAD55 family RecA-like ATPase
MEHYDDIEDFREKEKPQTTAITKAAPARAITKKPHSVEIEKAVIACCFLSPDNVGKVRREGITERYFFDIKLATVWSALIVAHERGSELDELVVAEVLQEQGKLQAVGGYVALSDMSGYVDTDASLKSYLSRLRELYVQRYTMAANKRINEMILAGELTSPAEIQAEFTKCAEYVNRVISKSESNEEAKSLADFSRPSNKDESCLLGKNRYACRGSGFVLSGPSGVGKTSTTIQMAAQFALGRDFMGIVSLNKWRVLIIQAEDDDGDIGEVKDSVFRAMNYSDEEIQGIRERVFVQREKTHIGDRFLAILPEYLRKYKPDIVIINPLLSYLGGDVSKQEVTSKFLREGLNAINKDDKFMWLLVHHTNKPSNEKGAKKNSNEYMYNMTGSSDIVNWARGIMTLESTENEGVFVFRLAKRGNRAGLRVNKSSDPIRPEWETQTKVYMKHSKQSIEFEGQFVPLIKWELARPEDIPAEDEEKKASRVGRPESVALEDLLRVIPKEEKAARSAAVIKKAHMEISGSDRPMCGRTWDRKIGELKKQGLVRQREDGKFWRTQCANDS